MSLVSFPQGFNNDAFLGNVGLVFATPLGESSFLRVGAGYQSFDFDAPPEIKVSESMVNRAARELEIANRVVADEQRKFDLERTPEQERRLAKFVSARDQLILTEQTLRSRRQEQLEANTQDSSDLNDYYYNVTLTSQLSSRISHVLSFGHESALGNISNFITADYINYGIGIIGWSGMRLSMSAYYEDAVMSGGRLAENLEQYGIDAYLTHQIGSRTRVGFGYHYGNTDSELEGWDFVQHAYSFDVAYSLSRKATLSAGYRYFQTDAEDDANDFDQNRFVLALQYNF